MSVIFPIDADAVVAMRSYFVMGANSVIDTSKIADDDVLDLLNAAEAELSRRLRVYLQKTKILPNDSPQSEFDALDASATPYAVESSYDYDPEFFKGDRWGFITTRERPIHSVESIEFAYPAPTNQVWSVPADWIRMDKKYGQIRLVPATQSFSAPLTAFVMQALGGGYLVPFMIRIRYFAGLENVKKDWPDVVNLVKMIATFRMLSGAFLPSSTSTSADGLSESDSIQLSDWEANIDNRIEKLREAIFGVRVSAMGVY
jgi:hypothetical protein